MVGVFKGLQEYLLPFKDYWVHIFEHNQMQQISDSSSKDVPFAMLKDELFSLSNLKNEKFFSVVEKLLVAAAKSLFDELHDMTKATAKYILSALIELG